MGKTIGEQAKELGISSERLFSLLYIEPELYRCAECKTELAASYTHCPNCKALHSSEPLWGEQIRRLAKAAKEAA